MVGLKRWSEDFLNLELRTNVFLGSREMGEKILRFIIEYDDVLTPETFDENGVRVKYEPPIEHWSLRGLFWANFFGPEYVDMWGREKLLAAPCYKVEPLSDGGVLLLLMESPLDASKPEYKAKKQELFSYLGEEAFTGSLLPRFRVGPGRKVKDARPLIETGGARDDVFWHESSPN